jgi:leucyl aminopeptidase
VPVFKGKGALAGPAIAVDKLLGGAVSRLVKQGEIKGRLGEVTILHTMGRIPSERIAVVGLGEKDKMDGETLRSASGSLVTRARALGVKHLGAALFGAGVKKTTYQLSAQLMAEGAVLGSYTFERYKKPEDKDAIESFTLIVEDGAREAQAEKGMTKGEILGRAQNFAKDLANEPSNSMTPAMLSEKARAIAKECGLKIDILSAADAAKEGMGAFLAVAKGSDEPAKFIVMRYRPSDKKPLALVGKGITFDSGGISLKPSQDMDQMKGDMSGAAAVLGAMWAIAQLKPKVGVLAVVPATENMPSGHALKPGDVVRSMGGKTIEIISTDAEGRLILADALEYANKMGAKRIVDIATLTGACVIALGEITTGLMSNDENLANLILKVSDETGEKMWRLPLFEEYDEQIKSEIADMKNSGGRPAGAITAGMFLKRFVGKTPWAHIDIAGTNLSDKARGYQQKGATGVCVRSLTELALRLGGR